MQCFSFSEQAVPFLRGMIDEDGDPVMLTPEGCGLPIILGEELTRRILQVGEAARADNKRLSGFTLGYTNSKKYRLSEYERRVGVEMETAMNAMVLKPASFQRRGRRRQEQALVRVETAGGANGKVRLTSCVHDEEMKGTRVVENYHTFPSMGIQALCTDEMLKQVNEGVEILDLFILMQPGSRFRIQRSGQLDKDVKKFINVTWTGETLRPMHPRYEDRPGLFVAA